MRGDRLELGDRMKTVARSTSQTMQRVKVGMSGLAAVVLLIGLASAIFSAASRERPVDVPGAANIDVVATVMPANGAAPADATNEPLAELGVAPSATNSAAPAPVNTPEQP